MIEDNKETPIKNINLTQQEYHRTSKKTYPKMMDLSFEFFFLDLMNLAPTSRKN
jgi:hypothetical protein